MHDVLVVDDNQDGAESLALYISMLGYDVAAAFSGAQALELIQSGMPQIVFLDLSMPDMSGYEVAREIRKLSNGNSVLLVAMTGWESAEHAQEAYKAGFNDHITKPIDLTVIEGMLTRTVRAAE